jgi:hypothetical protein
MDIAPLGHQDRRVTDAPHPARYSLTFLTDQWEWDAPLHADTPGQAKAAARRALLRMVKEETPELACVTLLDRGVKIGVWDWVEQQPYWTAF